MVSMPYPGTGHDTATGQPQFAVYGASPIKKKRKRRTKAEMEAIREATLAWVAQREPCTVRQAFYLVANNESGLIDKDKSGYRTIQGQVLWLRRNGHMPYGWITDSTRLRRKRASYRSLSDALTRWANNYRRDLWASATSTCEVWVEKDTLSGVLLPVTDQYDVPLCIGRGYGSETFLNDLAEEVSEDGRPCYIYLVGDHDASGVDITRDVEKRIRGLAPDAEIHFERLALTPEQIIRYQLPARDPTLTDSRAKKFEGPWVDVEAMDPDTLRDVVRAAIERHVNFYELQQLEEIERLERQALTEMAWGVAS